MSEPAVIIRVSDNEVDENITAADGFKYIPNYGSKTATDGYLLNTLGSSFEKPATSVAAIPFRPYFLKVASPSPSPSTKAVSRIIFDSDGSSFAFGDEDPTEGEIGEGLLITVKGHTVSVRSALREATDVRIINVSGITHNSFTLQPGETVNTFLPIGGVYIVRASAGRYQQKLVVK